MKNANDFETQAQPYLENLCRVALCVSNTESEAQDLVQKSYSRANYFWHKEQVKPNCRIWLFKNLAEVFFTKYPPFPGLAIEPDNGGKTNGHLTKFNIENLWPSDFTIEDFRFSISANDVREAIKHLPNECKFMTVLFLVESLPYLQIVEITNLQLAVVKSKLHNSRRLISESLLGKWRQNASISSYHAKSGGKNRLNIFS